MNLKLGYFCLLVWTSYFVYGETYLEKSTYLFGKDQPVTCGNDVVLSSANRSHLLTCDASETQSLQPVLAVKTSEEISKLKAVTPARQDKQLAQRATNGPTTRATKRMSLSRERMAVGTSKKHRAVNRMSHSRERMSVGTTERMSRGATKRMSLSRERVAVGTLRKQEHRAANRMSLSREIMTKRTSKRAALGSATRLSLEAPKRPAIGKSKRAWVTRRRNLENGKHSRRTMNEVNEVTTTASVTTNETHIIEKLPLLQMDSGGSQFKGGLIDVS